MRRIDDYMDALCANNQNNREVKMLYNRELDYSNGGRMLVESIFLLHMPCPP